jgi:hypothetical protein
VGDTRNQQQLNFELLEVSEFSWRLLVLNISRCSEYIASPMVINWCFCPGLLLGTAGSISSERGILVLNLAVAEAGLRACIWFGQNRLY